MTVHSPTPAIVIVLPLMLQTLGGPAVKVTGWPEPPPVALTVNGSAPYALFASALKVIACEAADASPVLGSVDWSVWLPQSVSVAPLVCMPTVCGVQVAVQLALVCSSWFQVWVEMAVPSTVTSSCLRDG